MKKLWPVLLTYLFATTNNTISVDGNNDFATDEDLSTETSGYTNLLTWDANYLYFAVSGSEVHYDNKVAFIYIDTDPNANPTAGTGTTSSLTWGGRTHTLPFSANWVFAHKGEPGGGYYNLRNYSGQWNSDQTFNGSVYKNNQFLEMSIKWSDIGSPTEINVVMFFQNDDGSWTWSASPSGTITAGSSDRTFTRWLGFNIETGVSPDAAQNSNSALISGTAGFRMLSPPVSNGTYSDLLAELWTQGMTGSDAPEASGDNVWTFALGSGAAGTWSAATNLGNTMTAGAGFLVYVFADNNFDGTDDLPKTLSVGGSENSGNVTYPASGSIDANQYGLSGNPYYTTIDWDDVTKNNVTGTVYVYNDAKSGGAGYINWNGSSGDLTGGLIAPFQGFWVQATGSGSGSIQIQTADKATSAGTFYRMLDTVEEGSMYFEFSSVDGGYDKVWFSFNNDGDKDKDTRDAYKLMPLMASSRLVAMSYADEHSLDINNLPFSNDTDIDAALDVMYLNLEESYYTLSSSEVTATWDISQLPDHIEMVLLDQVTGDVIHLDHMSSYSFSTEEEAGFSAVYDNAVASYPVSGSPRFIVQLRYGALDSDLKESVPETYSLSPVYPNPFNPSATVQFDIREWSRVQLDVYDIKGALVETLLDRKLTPGSHRYRWQPSSISAGVYFLRLTTPDEIFTQKVTYVK